MKPTYNFYFFVLLLLSLSGLFFACSSETSEPKDNSEEENNPVGVFIDSPVSGINYKTDSYSGKTDKMGRFDYKEGEEVEFSIGDIVLPKTKAESIVHLTKIFNSTTDDVRVLNLARLLLTLDEDNNPENGISISPAAFTAATNGNLDFSSESFDADVSAFIANAGGASDLVSKEDAKSHIDDTLVEANNFTDEDEDAKLYGCGNTCVQRANYHDFVEDFYPRHMQINVPTSAKIKLTLASSLKAGSSKFHVELFPIKPSAERCRIDYGGFRCGDEAEYDWEASSQNLVEGAETLFGNTSVNSNNELVITPEKALLSNTTYVVHIYNDGIDDFKTWWIFTTAP